MVHYPINDKWDVAAKSGRDGMMVAIFESADTPPPDDDVEWLPSPGSQEGRAAFREAIFWLESGGDDVTHVTLPHDHDVYFESDIDFIADFVASIREEGQ